MKKTAPPNPLPTRRGQQRRLSQVLILLILGLALSACGFKLRGIVNLAPELQQLHVDNQQISGAMHAQIDKSLRANQITQVSEPGAARFSLKLYQESFQQRTLSISNIGNRTRAAEYELSLSLKYDLQAREGWALQAQQTLSTVKTYSSDFTNLIGKQEEAQLLRREMQAELARQLMLRLQAITSAEINRVEQQQPGQLDPEPLSPPTDKTP